MIAALRHAGDSGRLRGRRPRPHRRPERLPHRRRIPNPRMPAAGLPSRRAGPLVPRRGRHPRHRGRCSGRQPRPQSRQNTPRADSGTSLQPCLRNPIGTTPLNQSGAAATDLSLSGVSRMKPHTRRGAGGAWRQCCS